MKTNLIVLSILIMSSGCVTTQSSLTGKPGSGFLTQDSLGTFGKAFYHFDSQSASKGSIAGMIEKGVEKVTGTSTDHLWEQMDDVGTRIDHAIVEKITKADLLRFSKNTGLKSPDVTYYWKPKTYLKKFAVINDLDFVVRLSMHFTFKEGWKVRLKVNSIWEVFRSDGSKILKFKTNAVNETPLKKRFGMFDARLEVHSQDYFNLAMVNTESFIAELGKHVQSVNYE